LSLEIYKVVSDKNVGNDGGMNKKVGGGKAIIVEPTTTKTKASSCC
jgi:hypothetical protein